MSNSKDFSQKSKIKFPPDQEKKKLQRIIDKLLENKQKLRILEAGCGSASHVSFKQDVFWVGIDISREQLEENTYLDEKIFGDIQNYKLKEAYFDLIICWNVLEHVKYPEKALRNFLRAVKKDGFIILAMPNVMSTKGLITKFSPHWFHVFIYKYIYKIKKAGEPGYLPFKTYLKFTISLDAIKRFAQENNLSIEYIKVYESYTQQGIKKNILINLALNFLSLIIKIITFGKFGTNHSDIIVVLKK